MIKIAITGNIASGKSVAENVIETQGYKVIDADVIAHKIMDNSEAELKIIFKDCDIWTNGKADRRKIAGIVFSDKNKLLQLEALIHPKVKTELLAIFEMSTQSKIFVSVPQLFEAGFENMFDKIICITAPQNIRLERLMRRNGVSEQDAKIRIASQLPDKVKASRSNYVICNDRSKEDFEKDILKVLANIC
ncbi:MAG: dephospho-CoA kinase [bacterium]|nr:dephospho-CoA kinase [bacterium]